eukprot:1975465-Pleurochrysis_carterae.AAC.1
MLREQARVAYHKEHETAKLLRTAYEKQQIKNRLEHSKRKLTRQSASQRPGSADTGPNANQTTRQPKKLSFADSEAAPSR